MGIEACNSVLVGDLFNKSISSVTQEQVFVSSLAFFQMGESEAFSTYQNWVSRNGGENLNIGARFPVKGFPVGVDIGGSGRRSFNSLQFKEEYSRWRTQTNFSQVEQESSSLAGYFATFERDPKTIEAWVTCVTSITSQNNEPEILGYGFRDESKNAFISLDWVPGEFLAEDIALLNIDTPEGVSIGGQFEPDFRMAPGSGVLFPVITDENRSFSVLANVKVLDKDNPEQVKGLFQTIVRIPPENLPAQVPTLKILVHLQGIGDLVFQEDELAGTRDESRRLEGFQIEFVPPVLDLGMRYMAHLENIGDVNFVDQGTFIGTRGESRRLEGFAVELTGSKASGFDVFYSAFLGTSTFGIGGGVGDTPIFSNGQFCGTRGEGRILSGIKVDIRRRSP